MKKLVLALSFLIVSQNAFSCLNFDTLKKVALQSNNLIVAYFLDFKDDKKNRDALPFIYLENHEIANMNFYLYDNISSNENFKYFNKKYNLNNSNAILIIDGKGNELYKMFDVFNKDIIDDMLLNFSMYKKVFAEEFYTLSLKENYSVALRISQKYYDLSLLVDNKYKSNVVNTTSFYYEIAEKKLSKKDKQFFEKTQKLELFKLYNYAFQKSFIELNSKLNLYKSDTIYEENKMHYYFLKYITAKAMQSEELNAIEEKTKSIDGFDYYVNKVNLILNQKDLVIN